MFENLTNKNLFQIKKTEMIKNLQLRGGEEIFSNLIKHF